MTFAIAPAMAGPATSLPGSVALMRPLAVTRSSCADQARDGRELRLLENEHERRDDELHGVHPLHVQHVQQGQVAGMMSITVSASKMSTTIINRLRSTRSTHAPMNRPNRRCGRAKVKVAMARLIGECVS